MPSSIVASTMTAEIVIRSRWSIGSPSHRVASPVVNSGSSRANSALVTFKPLHAPPADRRVVLGGGRSQRLPNRSRRVLTIKVDIGPGTIAKPGRARRETSACCVPPPATRHPSARERTRRGRTRMVQRLSGRHGQHQLTTRLAAGLGDQRGHEADGRLHVLAGPARWDRPAATDRPTAPGPGCGAARTGARRARRAARKSANESSGGCRRYASRASP